MIDNKGTLDTGSIDVNKFLFEILAQEPNVQIHPALDFIKDKAYVGLTLQCKDPKVGKKPCLFLVTEEEAIRCTDEELSKRNIELLHQELSIEKPRWSSKGLTAFFKTMTCVEPKTLFQTVRDVFSKHIEFSDESFYDLITLWTVGTYFFPLFNAYPYIYVGGLKDSGKTRLLTLCGCMSFNGCLSGSISTACLYRMVQDLRCTLLIDEKENLASVQRYDEFEQILKNGYKKGNSVFRSEMTSKTFRPTSFQTYGPKIVANIGGLGDVLESRCITILMHQGSNKEIIERELDASEQLWQDVRDMIYPFLLKNWKTVRQSYSDLKNETSLIARDWELWKPILALARVFDDDTYKKMVVLAEEKTKERKDETMFTPERDLLEVLLEMVDKDDFYRLGTIKRNIGWNYDKEPTWLSEKFLANLLKKFGFNKSRKGNQGYEYFLTVSRVKELAVRFSVSADSEHSEHSERTTEG
jgi:hypothetical protein